MNLALLTLAGAAVIELLAAIVIVVHVIQAISSIRKGGSDLARGILAEGVLAAFGFSLASTLLKVIRMQQWVQIRTFTVVFVLRIVLKQVFVRESASIGKRRVLHTDSNNPDVNIPSRTADVY